MTCPVCASRATMTVAQLAAVADYEEWSGAAAHDCRPGPEPGLWRGLAVAFVILVPAEILVLACAWVGLR